MSVAIQIALPFVFIGLLKRGRKPVFNESQMLHKVLDRPRKHTIRFITYPKTGKKKKLVLKSSRITSRRRLHSNKRNNYQIQNNCSEDKVDQLVSDFSTQVSVVGFSSHLEDLTLDVNSDNYSLPDSINRMGQLKSLCLTSQTDYPSKLHNLWSIACLPNLTTIRFEHVSVPSLHPVFALTSLQQLSFGMCEINDALMSFATESALPNLTALEIDMCCDLKELPLSLCNLVRLQKLSIINCNELEALPERLGDLLNLESLNLHCCTKLEELPDSIGSLHQLRSIDISDCLSISVLPEEIGELCGLQVVKMNGCNGLQELPVSTSELSQLKQVICDEETSYLWMNFESDLRNLKINVVEDDRLESFMKIVQ